MPIAKNKYNAENAERAEKENEISLFDFNNRDQLKSIYK